ncbi:hypothetical protein TSAR_014686, partial [Trichomalopsis sarcophagae]
MTKTMIRHPAQAINLYLRKSKRLHPPSEMNDSSDNESHSNEIFNDADNELRNDNNQMEFNGRADFDSIEEDLITPQNTMNQSLSSEMEEVTYPPSEMNDSSDNESHSNAIFNDADTELRNDNNQMEFDGHADFDSIEEDLRSENDDSEIDNHPCEHHNNVEDEEDTPSAISDNDFDEELETDSDDDTDINDDYNRPLYEGSQMSRMLGDAGKVLWQLYRSENDDSEIDNHPCEHHNNVEDEEDTHKLNYNTNRQKINNDNFEDIQNGKVYKELSEPNQILADSNNLAFTWYSGGVSISKSSKFEIWPLYLTINNLPYAARYKPENLILAGIWFGQSKPVTNLYLKPLKKELETLYKAIDIGQNSLIKVKGVIMSGTCDAPAKASFLNMMRYNGRFGCQRCKLCGEKINKTWVYCYKKSLKLRIDTETELYALRAINSNKTIFGVKGPSALSLFVYKPIRTTSVDVMHCVYSGITMQLLKLWFDVKFANEPLSIRDSKQLKYQKKFFINTCLNLKFYMVNSNIHQLLHLPKVVEDLGPLWTTSCFLYEDINGKLKNFVHG